jgi:hypothetical protein
MHFSINNHSIVDINRNSSSPNKMDNLVNIRILRILQTTMDMVLNHKIRNSNTVTVLSNIMDLTQHSKEVEQRILAIIRI